MIPGPLTALAAFVLAWPLAGYPLLLKVITSLRPASAAPPAPTGSTPRLTVIVPTYNEAANIGERLRNIAASNYSAGMLDIIVVDSASADGTADLAETEARSLSVPVPVRVIREPARAGKAAAINRGLAAAQGDVIVVTDAPTVFEPDALTRVSSAFDDPAVGAATGTFVVTGEGGALQRSEQQFWRLRNRLRALEAGVDSTPFLSGELCAFRRDVVPALDEDTLADDMNIALQVRRRGYRCVVVEGARFSERRTDDARELVETKSRRAAGGIQELLRNRDLIASPRHGIFGLLIMPSALLYYVPVRVPALALLALAMLRRIGALPSALRALTIVTMLAAAAAVAVRARESVRMLFFNEWIFVQGWRRVLTRGMDVRWQQERSTRDRSPSDAHAETTR